MIDDQGESASSDSAQTVAIDESSQQSFTTSAATTSHTFTLPVAGASTDGTLTIGVAGDFASASEYAAVYVDGVNHGQATGSRDCGGVEYTTLTVPQADLSTYVADGQLVIELRNSGSVGSQCTTRTHEVQLAFSGTVADGRVTVLGAPVASFTASPESGTAPLSVTLDASASSDADGRIVNYQWSSSDGQSTAGQTATMTFTTGGAHVVTLTVTDDMGLTSTAERTINVGQDLYPVPSFTMSPATGLAPLTVNLDASAASDPDGSIVDYRWSSSDGQVTFGRTASFNYTTSGTYTVTLTVVDDQGLSATSTPGTVSPFSAGNQTDFSTSAATTTHTFDVSGGSVLVSRALRRIAVPWSTPPLPYRWPICRATSATAGWWSRCATTAAYRAPCAAVGAPTRWS